MKIGQHREKTTQQGAIIARTPARGSVQAPRFAGSNAAQSQPPTRARRVLRPQRINVRQRKKRPSVPVSFWREPDFASAIVWNVADVLEISETAIVLSTPWYASRGTAVQLRMLAGSEFYAFDARVSRSLELLNGSSRIYLEFLSPQRDLCAALRGLSRRRGHAA